MNITIIKINIYCRSPNSFFFNIYLIYLFNLFFSAALGLHCSAGAPGHVGSVVCGTQALLLRCASSVVVVHGLSCPAACGILVP